jgi:hypothetical protein
MLKRDLSFYSLFFRRLSLSLNLENYILSHHQFKIRVSFIRHESDLLEDLEMSVMNVVNAKMIIVVEI